MRIRKRPPRPAQQEEQMPPRYGFPSWFKQEHDEQKQHSRKQLEKDPKRYYTSRSRKEQEQRLLTPSATTSKAQQENGEGLLLHCRSEGLVVDEKCKAECPIRVGYDIAASAASAGGGINELPPTAEADEAIGEEPRTPPPFCGEKPALPRHKEKEQQHKVRHEEGEQQQQHGCSCGLQQKQQQIKDEGEVVVLRRDSFSAKTRSNKARKRMRMQQLATKDHQHPRDTAETSERLSHDDGGPQQSLDEEDGSSHRPQGAKQNRNSSYLEDVNDMGPLLRAVHSVISEAGSEGLTAREAAERILSGNLLPEADIPRSVKMAKAMRESPYLVELGKSSKFALWSTFLEESTKKRIDKEVTGNAAAAAAAGVPRKGKRQRTASAAASIRKSKREDDDHIQEQQLQNPRGIDMNEIVVCQEEQAQCAATLCQWQFDGTREQHENYDLKEVSVVAPAPAPAPAAGGRRLALDLNVAPDEEE